MSLSSPSPLVSELSTLHRSVSRSPSPHSSPSRQPTSPLDNLDAAQHRSASPLSLSSAPDSLLPLDFPPSSPADFPFSDPLLLAVDYSIRLDYPPNDEITQHQNLDSLPLTVQSHTSPDDQSPPLAVSSSPEFSSLIKRIQFLESPEYFDSLASAIETTAKSEDAAESSSESILTRLALDSALLSRYEDELSLSRSHSAVRLSHQQRNMKALEHRHRMEMEHLLRFKLMYAQESGIREDLEHQLEDEKITVKELNESVQRLKQEKLQFAEVEAYLVQNVAQLAHQLIANGISVNLNFAGGVDANTPKRKESINAANNPTPLQISSPTQQQQPSQNQSQSTNPVPVTPSSSSTSGGFRGLFSGWRSSSGGTPASVAVTSPPRPISPIPIPIAATAINLQLQSPSSSSSAAVVNPVPSPTNSTS